MEEHNGYYIIGAANGGEMYEWQILAAVYDPENDTYHLYEDSGCSCNYPFDAYWSPGPAVSKQELIREVNSRRTDSYGFRAEDFTELAQEVREFDPKEIN